MSRAVLLGEKITLSRQFTLFLIKISLIRLMFFAIFPEDIERAHLFFNKHGLEYYGTYHSHPKGEAIPSKQDLSHIQKYLFIISLKNFDSPDFAAYEVTGVQQAERVPLRILSDKDFSVKDIHSDGTKKTLDGFIVPEGTPDYKTTNI